jgi:hypothetical protein
MYEFKKFKVLGYTTDFNKCECCGKENLKGTVSILCLISDVVLHFGTGCAASADKYDTLDAAKEAKKQINSAVRHYKETVQFAGSVAIKILRKQFGTKTTQFSYAPNCSEELIKEVMGRSVAFYTNPENKGKAFAYQF